MFAMDKMVTIEVLKRSWSTRPRHWVPVFAVIMFLPSLAATLFFMLLAFRDWQISKNIIAMLPTDPITWFGPITNWVDFLYVFLLPVVLLGINLVNFILMCVTCSYRKAYFWFGVPMIFVYIAIALFTAFWLVLYFVPSFANMMAGVITADIMNILGLVYAWGTLGYSALFVLYLIFLFFYCVNYPAKYEEIYELRKQRLKAYPTAEERLQYRKRFYRDYKKGNWISMMLDLHFKSLEKGSTAPMRKDAYDFLVYYAAICDANVQKAVLDQYASEGRYFEVRKIFHAVKEKSDSALRGIRVILPHYEKPQPKPAAPGSVEPAPDAIPSIPPLQPLFPRKKNPNSKHYSPDDIG